MAGLIHDTRADRQGTCPLDDQVSLFLQADARERFSGTEITAEDLLQLTSQPSS